MDPAGVLIEKVKRPDGRGRWGAYVVAEDEHGVWLYTPQGSIFQATKDGVVSTCSAGEPRPPGVSVLHLVPPSAWWFARWQVSPTGVSALAIDICTPATFDAGERRWEYVDLELDLFKSSDGVVGIFDQDEFDDAVTAGEITPEEAAVCEATAAALDARLRRHDELFDELAWGRFAEAIRLDLPPIVDVSDA